MKNKLLIIFSIKLWKYIIPVKKKQFFCKSGNFTKKNRGVTRGGGGAVLKRGLFLWKIAENSNFFLFNFEIFFYYDFYIKANALPHNLVHKIWKLDKKWALGIFFSKFSDFIFSGNYVNFFKKKSRELIFHPIFLNQIVWKSIGLD